MDSTWRKINEAIHLRDTGTVVTLIPKYLKVHQSSLESIYEASEFFRKISDYKSALRILPKERVQTSGPEVSEGETKLELQLARLLNMFGASNYALRMIDRIQVEKRARSKVEMCEIYFCNYKFAEIIKLLGSPFSLPESEPWHQDWLLHFYLAISLAELNQTDEAIKRLSGIRALSSSELIRAMTLSYQGKFLMAQGELEKALASLQESQRFFQDQDQTADHAILHGFLGECYFRLGKFSAAEKSLKKALNVFYQPGVKPEEWVETALLLDQIPGYRKENQRLAPRLFSLYGSVYSPLIRAALKHTVKEPQIFSISKTELLKKKQHFDRASDIAWNSGRARLGLDLIDELICNLIYAGEYGLPQFRLYELLWPHEPFSFDQHQKRLERVVGRARARGYKILWKNLHLWLKSKNVTATSRPDRVTRGHSFLVKHPHFKRSDVEKYFSMSSTTANVVCQEWLKAGLIILEKRFHYRALIS
jgi:tetratricopeptide (TPR) repeat protein